MKRLFFHFALLFLSFSCICATCSKTDDGGTEPIELQHSTGFLVTIGVNGLGNVDSVCLRYGPAEPVTEYGQVSVDGGFIKRPKHTWQVINAANNLWQFKYNDGRYLGYKYDPNPIQERNRYTATMDQAPGENNLFLINKSGHEFYIQPAANKNVYLNTVVSTAEPPSPRHSFVRFVEGKKQMWFIMP